MMFPKHSHTMMRTTLPSCLRHRHLPSYRRLQLSSHQCHLHGRFFHSTRQRNVIKPFLLADIGEGIRECQIIQWFVQPGARVEQFDKLCEVQSDKAAVEITSPYDGVIKELHYEPDDMAIVGKPLLQIDIQSEISPEDEAKLVDTDHDPASEPESHNLPDSKAPEEKPDQTSIKHAEQASEGHVEPSRKTETENESPLSDNRYQTLATPAVRHLIKKHDIDIINVKGSGKDGRILKEDVHRHVSQQSNTLQSAAPSSPSTTSTRSQPSSSLASQAAISASREVQLTPNQTAMFKTMTASLRIPHFLYTTPTNLTPLSLLRTKMKNRASTTATNLTPLPFILKAVSIALSEYPLLNASLNIPTSSNSQDQQQPSSSSPSPSPSLTYHTGQNIGIAVATPNNGLLVPVIHDIQTLSVAEIAERVCLLADKARQGRLTAAEMKGATFTVSNIGAIGGKGGAGVVAPIIVAPQVAILGVGRSRAVPLFAETGELVKVEESVFSWSADHRVVDGAECARCAERVRDLLEGVEEWGVVLR